MMNQFTLPDAAEMENFLLATQILECMPGYFSILDVGATFVQANQRQIEVMGHRSPPEILGKTYAEFKGVASRNVDAFIDQDAQVIRENRGLRYLSYQKYADGNWRLLLGDKAPILTTSSKVIGVLSQAKDVTNDRLIDLSRFMFEGAKKYSRKGLDAGFNTIITSEDHFDKFSKKEMVVIFYLLRGKTANEIARIISRAEKTIHFHLDSIKVKANVRTKSELIEKLIYDNFMNVVPEDILLKF